MGLLRDSQRDVNECVEVLRRALTYDDPGQREGQALRVLPLARRLKSGRLLEAQLRKLIEAGDVERALKLMEAYARSRPIKFALLGALIAPLVLFIVFYVAPRFSGHQNAAVDSVRQCSPAAEALGSNIYVPVFGFPMGTTHSGGGTDVAHWDTPVAGERARGTLQYVAESKDDGWHFHHAALEVDGSYYLVSPCVGQVAADQGQGRLRHGYDSAGVVRQVNGAAPVRDGDPCQVTILVVPEYPDSAPFNCRITITCARKRLYGATETTGYAFCQVRDGAPLAAFDRGGTEENGDPIVEMDLSTKSLKMADRGYSFVIEGL